METNNAKRGRPRKGQALRVPLIFSVDPATRQKAQELRNAGYKVNELVEVLITGAYNACKVVGTFKLITDAWGIRDHVLDDPAEIPFADTK